jgi:hypothetical protein
MTVIREPTLSTLCRINRNNQSYTSADTCRYVIGTERGYECAKLSGFKDAIDQAVLSGLQAAVGDNCPGIGMSRPALPYGATV